MQPPYFREGDYVRFVNTHLLDRHPYQEGFVTEVFRSLFHTAQGKVEREAVRVRSTEGGLWSAPASMLDPISPNQEEIARRLLGDDYL